MEENEKYPQLKFKEPKLRCRKSSSGDEVFVPSRGWIVLTPEEWVRRHVVWYLTNTLRVPPTSIIEEYPVELNGQNQRADIVVYGPDAKPWLLVECKAPSVAIDRSVLDQAVRYNSVVGAQIVILTNGVDTDSYALTDSNRYVRCSIPATE